MTKYLVIVLIFLGGCYLKQSRDFAPVYTDLGIPYSINGDVKVDHNLIAKWIDLQFNNWISHKQEWKVGDYTDDALLQIVKLYPVVVYDGFLVPGDSKKQYFGYTWYNDYIQIGLDYPCDIYEYSSYDPGLFPLLDEYEKQIGLSGLPHEFTHCVLGTWHPE